MAPVQLFPVDRLRIDPDQDLDDAVLVGLFRDPGLPRTRVRYHLRDEEGMGPDPAVRANPDLRRMFWSDGEGERHILHIADPVGVGLGDRSLFDEGKEERETFLHGLDYGLRAPHLRPRDVPGIAHARAVASKFLDRPVSHVLRLAAVEVGEFDGGQPAVWELYE